MQLSRRSLLTATTALAGGALLAACGGGSDDTIANPGGTTPPPTSVGPGNLQQVVANRTDMRVLAEALKTADLETTLQGTGPFTLFAPTDAAFQALAGELGVAAAELLADQTLLRAILTYHVVAGQVTAAQIPFGQPITTVQGDTLTIANNGGSVQITDARGRASTRAGVSTVTQADVAASNGVLHVIDRVLLPVAGLNLAQQVATDARFTSLAVALKRADLDDDLAGAGPLTLFAPTDAAFQALAAELGVAPAELLVDQSRLAQILAYHVVPGALLAPQVVGQTLATLEGSTFAVSPTGVITDESARTVNITATDQRASNGVLHVLGGVLVPLP